MKLPEITTYTKEAADSIARILNSKAINAPPNSFTYRAIYNPKTDRAVIAIFDVNGNAVGNVGTTVK